MHDVKDPEIIGGNPPPSDISADLFKVTASREEVALLFGERQSSGHEEILARLTRRILISPFVAKRLLFALQDAIRNYESKFGSLNKNALAGADRHVKRPPLSLPHFKSELAARWLGRLFEQLNSLDLTVGLERSFKMSEKKLSGNRFLLAFEPKNIGENPYAAISGICGRMGMPGESLKAFNQELSEATLVGFGIEEEGSTCVVKAYLEFRNRYEEAIRRNPPRSDPYVSHLGFKWDAADNAKGALANYLCYPGFTAGEMLERLAEAFYPHPDRNSLEVIKGILDLASGKVGPDKFLYLEVNEQGNPRSSFDINLYGANLRLEELQPYLLHECRHYSIPEDEFSRFYDSVKTSTLGHLAGGRDRKGRDFLTVYFGE